MTPEAPLGVAMQRPGVQETMAIHMLPLKGRQLFGAASNVIGGVQARKLFEDPTFVQVVEQLLNGSPRSVSPPVAVPKQLSNEGEQARRNEVVSEGSTPHAHDRRGGVSPVPTEIGVGGLPTEFSTYCHLKAGFDDVKWDLSETSGATHILSLDVENCPSFFADCALWELENKRKFLPPNCYVLACISMNAALQKKLLIGHVIEDLIKRNRLSLTKTRSGDSNASDYALTMATTTAANLAKGTPITMVSSDNDFNELHRQFYDEGVPFNRFQSYVGCFKSMGWKSLCPMQWAKSGGKLAADAQLFFKQLQQRLTAGTHALTLPEMSLPSNDVTEIDFSKQVPLRRQKSIIAVCFKDKQMRKNNGKRNSFNLPKKSHNNYVFEGKMRDMLTA